MINPKHAGSINEYGDVAIRAVEKIRSGAMVSPAAAWDEAAREVFPCRVHRQKKGCPRGAFLGLCDDGLVLDVPAGSYTRSIDNKAYALRAVELLRSDPNLAVQGRRALWNRVEAKAASHNSQMDVVLALHQNGLLKPR
ncbi:DUF6979 family protein [Longimicrobium sp.]|uniref:DUF6979 family protein n=1 Tax=Longimicrobium sp. TaxID=2029185 RepID=UPI002E31DB43|nr:hypothetical protein [Longimicrobium sp.]HEX6037039.1 hypothetical protein [Longimicrobium sp.]